VYNFENGKTYTVEINIEPESTMPVGLGWEDLPRTDY
jgi:hypothetical protein